MTFFKNLNKFLSTNLLKKIYINQLQYSKVYTNLIINESQGKSILKHTNICVKIIFYSTSILH